MKSKRLTIKMMGIIIMSLLFSVVSCKKESGEASAFSNIKSVRSEVLANPKIQEMLSVLKSISIQTDANGILCFDNKEVLNEVIKSYNTSNSFKVDYHSIGASFQVKNDGNTIEATGIVLHNSQQ